MPASFAALESRVNRAVMKTLSNRTVIFTPAGGPARELAGIFDADYARMLEELVTSSTPAMTFATESVEDATRGAELTFDSTSWEVVEVEPDGAGLTVLRLRKIV